MSVLQNIKIALGRWMTRRHHDNRDAEIASYVDLTRTLVKCALDNGQWEYRFDKEMDCFFSNLTVGNSNVVVVCNPLASYIYAQSIALQRPVDSLKLTDALLFCNKWNSNSLFPKAYIEGSNNTLVGETVMTFGENTGVEYVQECILKNLFDYSIAFFEEAEKSVFLPDRKPGN